MKTITWVLFAGATIMFLLGEASGASAIGIFFNALALGCFFWILYLWGMQCINLARLDKELDQRKYKLQFKTSLTTAFLIAVIFFSLNTCGFIRSNILFWLFSAIYVFAYIIAIYVPASVLRMVEEKKTHTSLGVVDGMFSFLLMPIGMYLLESRIASLKS